MNGTRPCSVNLASLWRGLPIAVLLFSAASGLDASESPDGLAALLPTLLPADAVDTHGHAFQRRAYCGHNLGRSFLDPEPRQPDVLRVGDTEDSGYNAVFGVDINRWLSAEINLAHLGSATIDQVIPGDEQTGVDQISYQLLDVSAIAYLFNSRGGFANEPINQGLFCRQALSVYARLGYGIMRNEAELGRVDHGRNHESHVTTGLGLEYGFINGLAVRAEYIRFDTDARFASIGLIARFGETRCAPESTIEPLPIDASSIDIPLVDPLPNDPVSQFDSFFDVDQSSLSAATRAQLSDFADAIRDTDQQVYIAGHADRIGDSRYNLDLSVRRADAVRSFLEAQGIDVSRIDYDGFGEDRPIDSNETPVGRAKNRRVEIRLR